LSNLFELLGPLIPKHFDKNELYVIGILLLVWGLFYAFHKRERILSKTEIISILVFNQLFATVGDRLLAEPPLDFYDTLDYAHGEFFDSLLQVAVYPVPILIFIHFYYKYKPRKVCFLILCAVILSFLEWVSVTFFNLYQYKEWNTVYSFIFYLFAMTVNLYFSHLINKLRP
jgi:hypothetical protein